MEWWTIGILVCVLFFRYSSIPPLQSSMSMKIRNLLRIENAKYSVYRFCNLTASEYRPGPVNTSPKKTLVSASDHIIRVL